MRASFAVEVWTRRRVQSAARSPGPFGRLGCRVKNAIERALRPLIGLQLWAVGRAGSLECFQFGDRCTVSTLRGGSKVVGEYALHLDCPWQFVGPAGQVVVTDESDPELLAEVADPPLVCAGASASDDGGAQLRFAGGSRLVVEPGGPDHLEYWRLFRPAAGGPHFVVGPAGIED
jgi:hypothetical protein